MSRKGNRGVIMEGLVMPTKTRKRGCSSSSSSSSRIQSYRLNKRAILVGKNRAGVGIGLGRSRSSTPVPTWRTTPLRGGTESPKHSQGGKSARPVTARMLAATLWEMNGMPSPKMSESNLEGMKRQQKRSGSRMAVKGEKMQAGLGLHLGSGSGSLPRHLSDPPHSPTVSEKMDRSGTGSNRRRTPSISQRLIDHTVGVVDTISNASFMEIETRSRPPTSSGSVTGSRSRLKDVSSALTTSKELLKIINRMWTRADQASSSLSLISALHTELERARLHVNHLIQEQRTEKTEINYLIKCFAEEKASWQAKQQQAVEAALRPIASELEAERKLRRRLESLNGKLGKEVTEAKSSLFKAVKELEREKRAREVTEQAIDEVEKEREMLELADKLREERVQMKLSEAKHQFEEKNSAITKLRKHLEAFLGTKRDRHETVLGNISSHVNEGEDGIDSKGDSGESDLHSIELDMKGDSHIDKEYKRDLTSNGNRAKNSASGQASCRSVSDGVDWTNQSTLKHQSLPSSRLGMVRENHSPLRDKERSWPSRDALLERSTLSKSRTADVRGESQANRRPKR